MSLMTRLMPIFQVKVIGPSMRPTLENGQKCLAVKGHLFARPGAIAIFAHPDRPELIEVKRLIRKTNGKWWVAGDNESESTDSRDFGEIESASIKGIMIKK
jgi:nickel-type superoxide dismutase maturation protease